MDKQTAIAVGVAGLGGYALYRYLSREARLFVCGQQTAKLQTELVSFLGWRTLNGVKAASPPFNLRADVKPLAGTKMFNAPVFGPAITNATMALFASPEMTALAKKVAAAPHAKGPARPLRRSHPPPPSLYPPLSGARGRSSA